MYLCKPRVAWPHVGVAVAHGLTPAIAEQRMRRCGTVSQKHSFPGITTPTRIIHKVGVSHEVSTSTHEVLRSQHPSRVLHGVDETAP